MRIPILLGIILTITIIISISYTYGQNNETNSIQMKTYTHPDNKFSVDYPSKWKLEPRENIFDTKDVEFSTIDKENGNSVHLAIITTEISKGINVEEGGGIIPQLTATRENFKSIEPWECEKYVISNEKACSIVYTTGFHPFQFAEMNVYTIDNTTSYIIVYRTTPDLFDKYLPTVELITQSINFTN